MSEPRVGQTIDRRYLLKREIARGGMAVIFEADHLFTGGVVAVKLLHEQVADDREARSRLLREAKALTRARHPNVVAVLDAGLTDGDAPYLVMEMLEGRSLDGILTARSCTPVADAVHILRQLCEALAFLHARGLIHRDIKPGNVFLARSETGEEIVKLVDFGIASIDEGQPGPRHTKITQQGDLLGTPEYMAPEQLMMSQTVDHRVDIYAAGVLLYECLVGSVPFEGNYPQVLLQVAESPIPTPIDGRPDIPPKLAAVVERALAKAADARFTDACDFAQALAAATGIATGRSSLLGIRSTELPSRAKTLRGMAGRAPPPDASEAVSPRRRYARAPYVTPVRVVEPDGNVLVGRSEDISEGGLLVLLPRPCTHLAEVQVSFALPTTGVHVTLAAIARWAKAARGQGATGIELVDPGDEARAAIAAYIRTMGGLR